MHSRPASPNCAAQKSSTTVYWTLWLRKVHIYKNTTSSLKSMYRCSQKLHETKRAAEHKCGDQWPLNNQPLPALHPRFHPHIPTYPPHPTPSSSYNEEEYDTGYSIMSEHAFTHIYIRNSPSPWGPSDHIPPSLSFIVIWWRAVRYQGYSCVSPQVIRRWQLNSFLWSTLQNLGTLLFTNDDIEEGVTFQIMAFLPTEAQNKWNVINILNLHFEF